MLDNEFHLLDYWAVLRRRRWVVYLALATVTLIALLGSYVATPLYRSTATLQIERQNPDILNIQDLAKSDYSWASYENFYQTQYKVLASDRVSRLAVRRLGLASHPRILEVEPSSGDDGDMRSPEDRATAWVQSGLEIVPVRNSHLVEVSWVFDEADLAARVANAVAEAFIQFNIESRYTTTDQASEFLVDQIGALKTELETLEGLLRDYGKSKSIVSIDESSNITLQALSDVSRRKTETQATLAEKEAAYRTVLNAEPEALPEVSRSDLIARLKQEYAATEAKHLEMSRRFKDDWPELRVLTSKLEGARQRLEAEIQEIADQVTASAEADYQQALSEVENLDRLLGRQQVEAQNLKGDAAGYATLLADVDRKRETLNSLITRQSEMALSTRLKDLDATSGNVKIIDRARPASGPFRPRKQLNVILGFVLGLGFGVVLAFVLEYLDNTISSPNEVEKLVHLPTLAVIPKHGASATSLPLVRRRAAPSVVETVDLIAHRDGRAEVAEAFRELRTSILLSGPGREPRQISITSALPEEGKSSSAVNLAIVLAQLGRKVLLVDADLRRPRIHRVFEVNNRRGISSVLAGQEEDLNEVIVGTGIENLDMIPSGPIPPNPSELLNSKVFAELGSRFLESGYGHVVFDSPPVLSVSDPMIVADVMDITLLVVRADRTPRESIRMAVERLTQGGSPPVGVIINGASGESLRYAYRSYGRPETEGTSSDQDDDARPRRAGGA